MYNVRCTSPITEDATQEPQLLSLCQADTYPFPSADCAAYVNLTANGVVAGEISHESITPFSL